jgi:UDP-galactopyranose mutase
MDRKRVLVLGAGLTGLSAAYHLEQAGLGDYLLLERETEVGGLARTRDRNGFRFDHAIHILYTRDAYAAELICDRLLPGRLRREVRESYCYTNGQFTEYPYQTNTYGLPTEIVEENIEGLLKARAAADGGPPPAHFEQWILATFGSGIARNFMLPYNRKQWAWDLREMAYDWIEERVPVPDVREVLLGALQPPRRKFGPNHEFWYPTEGGIGALPLAFLEHLPEGRLGLGAEVVAIDGVRHAARLAGGEVVRYERLISTLPIPALVALMGEDPPPAVRAAAATLRSNRVYTVDVSLRGSGLRLDKPMHWAYFPDDTISFHRISFPHRFSEWMVPAGCSSIQAEISASAVRPREAGRLVEETLRGLVAVGLLDPLEARLVAEGGRVLSADVDCLDPAYVIYDLEHRANVGILHDYLLDLQIDNRGRFGSWEYLNMDHAILSGREAALACR